MNSRCMCFGYCHLVVQTQKFCQPVALQLTYAQYANALPWSEQERSPPVQQAYGSETQSRGAAMKAFKLHLRRCQIASFAACSVNSYTRWSLTSSIPLQKASEQFPLSLPCLLVQHKPLACTEAASTCLLELAVISPWIPCSAHRVNTAEQWRLFYHHKGFQEVALRRCSK